MQKLGKFMAVNIYQNLPKTTKNFSTKQCPKVSAMADSFVSTNKKSFLKFLASKIKKVK